MKLNAYLNKCLVLSVYISKEVHISQMVHCDFGWGGKCNGFYVNGVFAPFDSITGERKEQYNRHLRMVTYKRS